MSSEKAPISRRSFLNLAAKTSAGLGAVAVVDPKLSRLLSNSGRAAVAKPAVSVESNLTDTSAIKAMQEIVNAYNAAKTSTGIATLDTVAGPISTAQFPTYLSEPYPPNALVYWGGNAVQAYGNEGYLLDLSSIWDTELAHYSKGMKALATDAHGKQIFVPQNYYWWGMFYRKSMFKKWGVSAPTTWSQFIDVCEKIKKQGVNPIVTSAASPQPWPFVGWFDYLDLRINGAKFHLDLLHGKHSFNSPQVKEVFTVLATVLPYFDRNSSSYQYQDAATPLVQGTAGMYLMGALVTEVLPASLYDDMDFFKFPVINAKVADAEEAPTNGFISPRKVANVPQTLNLLAFLVSDQAQEIYCDVSQSSSFPVSPTGRMKNMTALDRKGLALLQKASTLTQFFNRDSSDALQTTNYNAMEEFWNAPTKIDSMLATWEAAAQRVFKSQG
jgi:multiple sugar transport system substrate-binding protein